MSWKGLLTLFCVYSVNCWLASGNTIKRKKKTHSAGCRKPLEPWISSEKPPSPQLAGMKHPSSHSEPLLHCCWRYQMELTLDGPVLSLVTCHTVKVNSGQMQVKSARRSSTREIRRKLATSMKKNCEKSKLSHQDELKSMYEHVMEKTFYILSFFHEFGYTKMKNLPSPPHDLHYLI